MTQAERLYTGLAIAVLTALGFVYFPGHSWIHQDTQIWAPMLERLWDPSVLSKDLVATRPHLTYTIYDEVSILLRRLYGEDFQFAMYLQQLLTRALGLFGVFLIGRAMQLSAGMSLLLVSFYGLGAFIAGPSVLTIEYEPVPRGFAGPLLMLAAGLTAHGLWIPAGVACGAALLYHPPTAAPFCLIFLLLAAWPWEGRAQRLRGLIPIGAAILVTLLISRLQAGESEQQRLFATIDPELEKLQRLRGSYNWITLWGAQWIRQHQMMFVISMAAMWRLRAQISPPLRFLLRGLAIYGIISIPLSYCLLEGLKWSLMPQFQPARATLFLTVIAVVASGACGVVAARAGRLLESTAWFVIPFAAPVQFEILQILLPDWRDPLIARRAALVLLLAFLSALAARWEPSRSLASRFALAAALLLPFYLIPEAGRVVNFPDLDQPELRELAVWARQSTPKDAVFLFADNGKNLQAGIFRALSLRAQYVDWKSGGQVNLLRDFALEWWGRWSATMEKPFDPANLDHLRNRGISHLVLKKSSRLPNGQPVFENRDYLVYTGF